MSSWVKITFREVASILQGRQVVREEVCFAVGPDARSGEVFTLDNGVEIGAVSVWSGPYSQDTPDIDGEPPEWFIRRPTA